MRRSISIVLSLVLLSSANAALADCGGQTCAPGFFCSCVLEGGLCVGNYVCTSACQGSFTGAPGAGCAAGEVCLYALEDSANEHVCGLVQDDGGSPLPLGNRLGGADCEGNSVCSDTCASANDGFCDDGGPGAFFSVCPLGSDCTDCGPRDNAPDASLCRSGQCRELCPGCGYTCSDYCDHSDGSWAGNDAGEDGSCAGTASCFILQGTTAPPAPQNYEYALCMPSAAATTGTAVTGESCASDPAVCRWGPQSCIDGVCAAPCRLNEHCPTGYYCSLNGPTHGNDTVPVCRVYPGAGTFAFPGGEACLADGDCASNFCEATHQICLDMCTDDASCAAGLVCTGVHVALPGGGPVTFVRMCLSGPDPLNSVTNPYANSPPALPSLVPWLLGGLALTLLSVGFRASDALGLRRR